MTQIRSDWEQTTLAYVTRRGQVRLVRASKRSVMPSRKACTPTEAAERRAQDDRRNGFSSPDKGGGYRPEAPPFVTLYSAFGSFDEILGTYGD